MLYSGLHSRDGISRRRRQPAARSKGADGPAAPRPARLLQAAQFADVVPSLQSYACTRFPDESSGADTLLGARPIAVLEALHCGSQLSSVESETTEGAGSCGCL